MCSGRIVPAWSSRGLSRCSVGLPAGLRSMSAFDLQLHVKSRAHFFLKNVVCADGGSPDIAARQQMCWFTVCCIGGSPWVAVTRMVFIYFVVYWLFPWRRCKQNYGAH